MNIEIKYQAEDGEIRYYHFESWELAEDDAFREAMREFRSTRTGKNKILSIRDASIGAGRMERILFFPVRVLRNSCIASRKASSSASSHDSKW